MHNLLSVNNGSKNMILLGVAPETSYKGKRLG